MGENVTLAVWDKEQMTQVEHIRRMKPVSRINMFLTDNT